LIEEIHNYNTRIKTSVQLYHSNNNSGHKLLKCKASSFCAMEWTTFISSRNRLVSCV